MKKVWIINQYNMPPEYGHLNRHYNFGKYFTRLGHKPVVFAGSFLHNINKQVIEDNATYKKYKGCQYLYYFIKTCDYSKSKIRRVYAMFEFYRNLFKVAKDIEKPDIILGSSTHPLAAIAAIRLAKKYKCQSIVEIRDLWPESFVAYEIIKINNPILKLLYAGEKWIYKNADKVIFTMEGGKDYLTQKGWDKENGGPIDLQKIYHINNGVDLEVFNFDKEKYILKDDDLDNENIFKIIYTGSIRKVNDLNLLLETAKQIDNPKIKFLIWGDGDERERLEDRCEKEQISNIIFKGYIAKRYIPYILSKADVNLLHGGYTAIMDYGMSANKLFDYIAAEKPILSDLKTSYDLIIKYNLGIVTKNQSIHEIKEGIEELYNMTKEEKKVITKNLKRASNEYDYKNLTRKLLDIIEMEVE